MSFTYEIGKDNSVTILKEGSIFSVQTDDPEVEGYDAFESKARATEWAEAAIARYAVELAAEAEASELANLAVEEAKKLDIVKMGDVEPVVEAELIEE